jgi:hypothetical protein
VQVESYDMGGPETLSFLQEINKNSRVRMDKYFMVMRFRIKLQGISSPA